jgi:hypothetical protein
MQTLAGSSPGLGSFVDDIVASVTGSAVSSATAAAKPLLDDIEKRVKVLLLPVVFFTAGSFLIGLLTYREVARKSKPLSGARRR